MQTIAQVMAKSQTVDLLSFRRTFTLVIALVVIPSAGLSGFGVLAIINERAAVEKKVEASWGLRLSLLSKALQADLKTARVDSVSPLVLSLDGRPLLEANFSVSGEPPVVEAADPHLKQAVVGLGSQLDALPDHPVFFPLASPQGTWVLAAVRTGGRVEGGRVSLSALEQRVAHAASELVPADDRARFALESLQREPNDGLLGKVASGVAEVREAALGDRELAARALEGPLLGFRLVAHALGEDPVAQASSRNRTVYGVLLAIFYLTLAIGVIYTGRTLYREARLSRLKTDFVSQVSHELRTPLTSIRMFIDTLAMGRVRDAAETQKILEMLSLETARLSTMIESVLDWSRIERGRKQYDKHPLALEAVIDTAVNAFKAQHHGTPFELQVSVEPGLPQVSADAAALSDAVLNLLSNAYKYTGEQKRIRIAARTGKKGLQLEVEDNGVGIPRSERRKIFDRFYRVDNLLSRATEGSGLGLSIAQRIIQAHGGEITVDSEPGKGSTFTVHLPPVEVG